MLAFIRYWHVQTIYKVLHQLVSISGFIAIIALVFKSLQFINGVYLVFIDNNITKTEHRVDLQNYLRVDRILVILHKSLNNKCTVYTRTKKMTHLIGKQIITT